VIPYLKRKILVWDECFEIDIDVVYDANKKNYFYNLLKKGGFELKI
jgi:hypothetical protein